MRKNPSSLRIRFTLVRLMLCFLVGMSQLTVVSLAHASEGKNVDQLQWLRTNAVPMRSIDPADEEFSDLIPLKEYIGKARVVFLGEQSHGDGSTFLAKGRLIRFLHQVMGFDVLAWESGTYDCRQMEAALHSTAPIEEATDQGVFRLWGGSAQVRNVFEYARSTYATTNPLEMAGFDPQFSTASSPGQMQKEILDFLEHIDPPVLSSEQKEIIQKGLNQFTEFRKMPPEQRQKFRFVQAANEEPVLGSVIGQLIKRQNGLMDVKSRRDLDFYVRCLQNLEVFEALMRKLSEISASGGSMKSSDNNIRDQRMGENIIWLAKERYPDRKIIVWAASSHNSRNLPSSVVGPDPTKPLYEGYVSMGQVAHDVLGDEMYSIAFTAYEGKAAILGRDPEEIAPAPEGSLESLMHQVGKPYLFVDFRNIQKDSNHWLHQPIMARPLGNVEMKGDWAMVFDAMIYTETMIPSMPSAPPTEAPKPKPDDKQQ
jgi:erythromycin esterase